MSFLDMIVFVFQFIWGYFVLSLPWLGVAAVSLKRESPGFSHGECQLIWPWKRTYVFMSVIRPVSGCGIRRSIVRILLISVSAFIALLAVHLSCSCMVPYGISGELGNLENEPVHMIMGFSRMSSSWYRVCLDDDVVVYVHDPDFEARHCLGDEVVFGWHASAARDVCEFFGKYLFDFDFWPVYFDVNGRYVRVATLVDVDSG